ncbi:adenylate/guanylate cyclase with integral membrane sensor [[Leptolyngbya] sp. PCC 7376]|nr:adenylate/guanylate cyclase with integral membrane sensor [[Leptolyngbya] sp. PCC 7376]
MDRKKPTHKKFRLRTILVVPFVLQILGAVGLVGYLSFRSGQEAVNEVAGQLRGELTNRINEKLASYAEIPHTINRLNISTVTQGNIDILNATGEYQFWQQMQIYPDISYIYCGDENGAFMGVARYIEDEQPKLRLQFVNPSTEFIRHSIQLDGEGQKTANTELITKLYDPRVRPWYEAAKATGEAVWSDIYLDFSILVPTVTASMPIYSTVDDSFVGVCGIDFFLPQELSNFLKTLEIGENGTAFIIERSGKLVATSTPESMTEGEGEETERLFARNSDNASIKGTAEYLDNQFADLTKIQDVQQLDFKLDGEKQYVQIAPFQNRNLDWLIVLTVPESDFMAQINAGRRNALILSLSALGLALTVGVLTARLITQPVSRLTEASKELADGDLDKQLDAANAIDIEEIDTLEQSFNTMAAQLQDSFTALESQKETLAQKNEELQRLDQLKDEFLANTSHELRTPLNGIIGIAESLIDGVTGELPQSTQTNLQLVVSSGRRLASLINDILDFSKLKHKTIELQLSSVDVRSMAQIILTLSQPLANQKNIQLVNAIPQEIPSAKADENRLQQIFYNLINNAIKFTPEGTVEISAKVIHSESREELAIAVLDTGIGIAEDKLDRIFQSFEQAEGSTAREYGGTGLGLAVTKKLVELHRGKIEVESQVRVGSKFTFTLPIAQEKVNDDAPSVSVIHENFNPIITPEPISQMRGESSSEKELKILIVDDEPINRQVLINHLSPYDYAVTEASNGQEALDIINDGLLPDLILLDIMMPNMTGYEVCHILRQKFLAHELPIVMLTAKNQVESIVEGFTAGANDYLTKPIQKQELLARMKTHLNLAKLSSAYGKFVPRDFLDFLDKESILEVQIGNQVQQEMTIMFADIRSFATLAEKMIPQDTFDFINAYLSRVSPVIREHHGFIDKYIGDAIMALFPKSVDGAAKAAIAMQKRVVLFNQDRREAGLVPIRIGIGLHLGNLMLGTIGEPERMETTVIADAVNLAARLESLTKLYGVEILISERTKNQLDEDANYNVRFLDRVKVKGKNEVVLIYELYGDNGEMKNQLKTETKQLFESAIETYHQQNFIDARFIFEEVLAINPGDSVARLYVERCQKRQQSDVMEIWEGINKRSF